MSDFQKTVNNSRWAYMWFYVGEKHKYIDIEYIEMQILDRCWFEICSQKILS